MRLLFKIFALLDVISICFMVPQIWIILNHFDTIPKEALSVFKVVFTSAIFLSLFVSAAGLFQFKKYGMITYYVQFPFRLILWVFSIGFITFLPELFHQENQWFGILFRICIVAEFFRIYYTIQAQRSLIRK
ncbi:hypothetical protein ACSBL2_26055 [Pedobacter sp. AW31-3R]|uniref:hypothetical protein n=1 Tax=Pedobacter sp. AW31-3R TaxID=3445781 RepID=UPI003FA171E7